MLKELGYLHSEQIQLLQSIQDFKLKYETKLINEDVVCPKCGNATSPRGKRQSKFHAVLTDHMVSIQSRRCQCGWSSPDSVDGLYESSLHPDLAEKQVIQGVLADREFASGDLFCWLNQQNIPFYVRIKEDSLVKMKNKTVCKAVDIFNDLLPKTQKHFSMNVWVYGQRVYLSGSRAENGELMIVATHQHAQNAIPIYLRRWEIKTLFSCLKGRGFRFEDTHITRPDRIEKLMALLSVAFCWAHKIGEWKAEKKPIPFKKFRQGIRPKHSLFRYGFNFIREIILNLITSYKAFKYCLKFLTGPPDKMMI